MLGEYARGAALSEPALRRAARAQMEAFNVGPADPSLLYSSMSRGFQRKAMLAKWLQTDPRLVLLDEPARGVDAESREQIFTITTCSL